MKSQRGLYTLPVKTTMGYRFKILSKAEKRGPSWSFNGQSLEDSLAKHAEIAQQRYEERIKAAADYEAERAAKQSQSEQYSTYY